MVQIGADWGGMPEIEISRGTLLSTLQATFDVSNDGMIALTSRVRLLGTLGVPSKMRPVAHGRLQYGLLEMTEIAMALALMNANMQPVLAAPPMIAAMIAAFTARADETTTGAMLQAALTMCQRCPQLAKALAGHSQPTLVPSQFVPLMLARLQGTTAAQLLRVLLEREFDDKGKAA